MEKQLPNIGAWVRAARQKAGLTGEALGARLNTSKANVSHWETGKHEPSFHDLLRIQDITGYPLFDVRADPRWPFKSIRRERIASLTDAQLSILEAGIEGLLAAITNDPRRKPLAAAG